MHRPSRGLRTSIAEAMGESDFIAGLRESADRIADVKRGMNTTFGAAIIQALNEVEDYNIQRLIELSSWRIFCIAQAKSEIMVARYIRSKLKAYVYNYDLMIEQIDAMENTNGQTD